MVALVLNGKGHAIRIERDVKVLQRHLGRPDVTEDRLDPIDHFVMNLIESRGRNWCPPVMHPWREFHRSRGTDLLVVKRRQLRREPRNGCVRFPQ